MAGTYGWSLRHIFEYVTYKDINELAKYAPERLRRRDAAMYQNLISIIHVASFHPEKGKNKHVEELFNSYNESDTSYRTAKFDKAGFNMLAAQVNANRAKAAS